MHESVAAYRTRLADARTQLFDSDRIRLEPLKTVRDYAQEVDLILGEIFGSQVESAVPHLGVCLVALGGYGRKELCPYSDVDILILLENGSDKACLDQAIHLFWDIGLTMGCVVRTLSECADIIGQDISTDTALLEGRYLAGQWALYEKLQSGIVKPYFEREKKNYLNEINQALREGIFSLENAIYRVEPHLKNGICCLRDCQRLLWAERVRNGVRNFRDLHIKSNYLMSQAGQLEAGYGFLMGLRAELHWLCKRRLDVLETSLQPAIAEQHGFGPDGAGRLMEQFFRTVRDIRMILLAFLEQDSSGRNIWYDVRRRLSANHLGPGIAVLDGILFSTRSHDPSVGSALWSLGVFKYAILHKATLSVELRNRLRGIVARGEAKDFRTQSMGAVFRDIMECPEPIGQAMAMMHETGLLGRLIPQFAALTCKVEYDSYHEFTIDQHTLQCFQTADAFAHDPDDHIRLLYGSLSHPLVLRLALLLHDIGKSLPGNHAHSGAVIAANVCERLGMSAEETKKTCFLVYHHLDMSDLSLSREPEDYHIREFAEVLGDKDMLDLLYLLTIADIRSVGRRTWTEWKAYQLEQLYEGTLAALHGGGKPLRDGIVTETIKREQDVSSELSLVAITDTAYLQDNTPEDRKRHRSWLMEVEGDAFRLHHEMFVGFERLTVCGSDRIGFLSDVIGCISSEGFNVLNARIYSTTDGKVLDIFHLEAPDKPRISSADRIGNLYHKWGMLSREEATADSLMRDRILRYPPEPLRLAATVPSINIGIDNSLSRLYTVVEIDTADNFGLLHKIARCFSENGINIHMARLSTRIDQAVDVFYVTDRDKMKITDLQKIEDLKGSLTDVIGEKISLGRPYILPGP